MSQAKELSIKGPEMPAMYSLGALIAAILIAAVVGVLLVYPISRCVFSPATGR
jgi:hypothetical protein